MPVIALTHEMGSLAKDIAMRMAEIANLSVLRHEVEDNVAGRMHVPTSLVRRVREGRAGLVERMSTDRQLFSIFTAEEVFAQAQRGNIVMRGWGATMLLRPVQHVLRVRVTRPFEQRVGWVMDHVTGDPEVAEKEVRRSDMAHATRMHALFGVTWGDPLLYDIVINTDRVSIETGAEQILAMAARPEFAETDESRTVLAHLALSARIRAALKANDSTRDVDVQIDAVEGRVVLSGIVMDDAERSETERVATTVAGLGSIDNRLRIMQVNRKFTHSKT